MTQDIEMLEYICKNAEMGRDNLSHILDKIEDAELHKCLVSQMEEYQKTYDSAYEMLDNLGHKPESAGVMAKTMAHLTSDVKTISDNSPSKIAEMVIQGNTMGVTKMTKRIHEYDGENKKIIALAQKQVTMEEDNIEEMKKFL